MTLIAALTWRPRGETNRFVRLHAQIMSLYDRVVIAAAPDTTPEEASIVGSLPGVRLVVREDWKAGRHNVLQWALDDGADHLHYADGDRLLRWIETRPDELKQITEKIAACDCLVIGRSDAAQATHPKALRETERITNDVFSHLLGQRLDFSSGSKAFSRACAEFILRNSPPTHPIGTDSEWIVLAWRGGFRLEPVDVDGLDWESADQFRDTAADAELQRSAAEVYDTDAARWAMRVRVANEITEAGLDAMTRELR